MPIHLRSGQLKEAPVQKYHSAFQIFREERSLKQSDNVFEEWKSLDEKKKQSYQAQYEKYLIEFKEELHLFYGGSKSDLKKIKQGEGIPPKPSRPIGPSLTYQHEVFQEVSAKNPKLSLGQLQKIISENYRQLSGKERTKYEKQYDVEKASYDKAVELWKEKYEGLQQEYTNFLEDKFRRITKKDTEFVYLEQAASKKVKKLKQSKTSDKKKKSVSKQ